ncbi:imidazolonepropionase [Desulfovibrio sp. OttesenSCG-928-I05]|nr:imidazolonepropionase [Desulfovibrio sp. OttesenSCG-928-I05]
MRTLFHSCRVVTPRDAGRPLSGKDQGSVLAIEDAALLVEDGRLLAVGPRAEVASLPEAAGAVQEDLGGACVVPGFVDPHTHMCFAARREEEFSMRLAGKTYLEILDQGGGILSSVKAVRSASDDELFAVTRQNAMNALSSGTTTVEVKSGYGLDTETELRMLRCIKRLRENTPLDVVSTFMGAHAIPMEYKERSHEFVDLIINEMLPAVAGADLAVFCDIFCETGVFSVEESRKILTAARAKGFKLKIHADEVNDLGGAALAGEVTAVSAEHLLAAGDKGLESMAASGTIAVLLPGTAYSLRKPYARARHMVDLNVPVALATDCNPGSCFCESMPFVMGLAVLCMGMSPEEALTGCTLNAAYAIGMEKSVGSLEKGKNADFLVLDGKTPATVPYHAGGRSVARVYKRGVLVARDGVLQ